METHLGVGSLRVVVRAFRRAMFGLGVAVAVGVLGQAAALYLSVPGGPVAAKAKAVQSLEQRYAP